MKRNAGTVVLGAATLAALGGCAYQDPLELPELGPQGGSSMPSPSYGYGFNYGYGSGYRPGYDPYYNYYYGGADPRYYGPGVVYVPYPRYVPVPCADANHNGRCDKPPRGDGHGRDDDDNNHHGGQNGGQNDGQNGGKHHRPPQWPNARDGGGPQVDGPRVRRGKEIDRSVAPARRPPQVQPQTQTPQSRPQDTPRRVAPPPADRGPRVGPGRTPAPSEDGSPPRRPD
jgi:hypothetical protein